MKTIILHGILKKHFCQSFKANVSNVRDIFNILFCNDPNYTSKICSIRNFCSGILIVLDNKLFHKDIDNLDFSIKNVETIELIPCVRAKGIFTGLFVAIGLSVTWASIASAVLTIAIIVGISLLVANLMKPKDPKQIKTSSYIFNGTTNVAARNTPIALNYGRLRLGSSVINQSFFSYDLSLT